MKCRKCGHPMRIEDFTRTHNGSFTFHYACTYCGSSCTAHKRTEHWFIQADDGMEYLKVETNKKEQK